MSVAVVIGTYGAQEWADLAWARAYPSVVAQGPGIEVIVRHEAEGGGLADARNGAAADAKADWLCFLDADDQLAPGYLDAMSRQFLDADERPVLLAPSVEYHHPDGRVEPARLPNRQAPMHVMNHCVIGTLVPKGLFRHVGGFRRDLADCLLEDWALWLACIRAGARIVDVPDAVYRAYERDDASRRHQGCYEALRAEHEASMNYGAWMDRGPTDSSRSAPADPCPPAVVSAPDVFSFGDVA